MFQNSNNALLKCRLSDPVLTPVIADSAGSRLQDKVRGGGGGDGGGGRSSRPLDKGAGLGLQKIFFGALGLGLV